MVAELEAGDACAASDEARALQSVAIAAINAGRVPGPLQEELLGSAGALAGSIDCGAAVQPAAVDEARSLAAWLRERSG